MAHVHFVGFRTDAQNSAAIKVWGRPDFVHKWHDKRMWGDIDPDNDIVVFAKGATLQPSKWTWQDHSAFFSLTLHFFVASQKFPCYRLGAERESTLSRSVSILDSPPIHVLLVSGAFFILNT